MVKNKYRWLILMATVGIWASAAGLAYAVPTCPTGTSNNLLSGTYTFNFFGSQFYDPSHPVAGSGSFTVDGAGHVKAAGKINCNTEGEFTSSITGGCYAVFADGTGFMSLATNPKVCSTPYDSGVDLQLSVTSTQVLFASDGSNTNFSTGASVPFAGAANRVGNLEAQP